MMHFSEKNPLRFACFWLRLFSYRFSMTESGVPWEKTYKMKLSIFSGNLGGTVDKNIIDPKENICFLWGFFLKRKQFTSFYFFLWQSKCLHSSPLQKQKVLSILVLISTEVSLIHGTTDHLVQFSRKISRISG